MKKLFYIIASACLTLAACGENKPADDTPAGRIDSLANTVNGDTVLVDSASLPVVESLPAPEDTAVLNKMVESIFQLPEVQKIHKEILKATNDEHGVSLTIFPGEEKTGEYEIKAGFNNAIRFETRLTFMVNVHTREIKITDNQTGDLLTIAEYRKLHY